MITTISFDLVDETISGKLDIFSGDHWSFTSDNTYFRKHFPHGLSSFMLLGHITEEKQQIITLLLSRLAARSSS